MNLRSVPDPISCGDERLAEARRLRALQLDPDERDLVWPARTGSTRTDRRSAAVEPLRALSDGQTDRLTTVAVASRRRGWVEVTAETTECDHFVITPQLADDHPGLTGLWHLTHVPTGTLVPGTVGLDVRELRDTARLVADLDWSSVEAGFYREGPHPKRLQEAVDRATGMPGRTS